MNRIYESFKAVASVVIFFGLLGIGGIISQSNGLIGAAFAFLAFWYLAWWLS